MLHFASVAGALFDRWHAMEDPAGRASLPGEAFIGHCLRHCPAAGFNRQHAGRGETAANTACHGSNASERNSAADRNKRRLRMPPCRTPRLILADSRASGKGRRVLLRGRFPVPVSVEARLNPCRQQIAATHPSRVPNQTLGSRRHLHEPRIARSLLAPKIWPEPSRSSSHRTIARVAMLPIASRETAKLQTPCRT